MEANVSRALIETIIRRTLSDVHEDSERRIRNLVDLALLVSKGRFQKRFFGIAQRMLENEQSPYMPPREPGEPAHEPGMFDQSFECPPQDYGMIGGAKIIVFR